MQSCHVLRCPYLLLSTMDGPRMSHVPYHVMPYRATHGMSSCHHVMSCHTIYSVVCLLVATQGLVSPCHVAVDAGPALAADWAQLWWPWRILRIASPHPAHRHHHSHSRCQPTFEIIFTIFREDTR